MITEPFAAIIERDDEKVSVLERVEHRTAILPPGDCVAKSSVHPLQDRGLQQEALEFYRLPLKHFLDQVISNIAIISAERRNEAVPVQLILHGERHHLQSRNPTFGAPAERSNIIGRQIEKHHLV